jgi:cysteine-rich repeat protein
MTTNPVLKICRRLLYVMAALTLASAHADLKPPAGQMCPAGAVVIGFDSAGNIVCSGICGNGVVDPGEACDDGNTVGQDGCSAGCIRETQAAAPPDQPRAEQAAAIAATGSSDMLRPEITDVDPSSVLYGKRETALTITGSGFTADTTVIFEGASYPAIVNSFGTEIRVTIPTANLTMGRYALRVSNGPGAETVVKKALVVY